MPELLWKAYIDFEEEEADTPEAFARPRALYERLLAKTSHVKVWTAFALFELNVPDDSDDDEDATRENTVAPSAVARARAVFERAHTRYRETGAVEERVALLQAWRSFEESHGDEARREQLAKQMPRRVKKRRRLDDDSFEEYMTYVFPADEGDGAGGAGAGMSKLRAMAEKWKREQEAQGQIQEDAEQRFKARVGSRWYVAEPQSYRTTPKLPLWNAKQSKNNWHDNDIKFIDGLPFPSKTLSCRSFLSFRHIIVYSTSDLPPVRTREFPRITVATASVDHLSSVDHPN
nr:pre-mrna-splicing factor clf1 [Quercus suber]